MNSNTTTHHLERAHILVVGEGLSKPLLYFTMHIHLADRGSKVEALAQR